MYCVLKRIVDTNFECEVGSLTVAELFDARKFSVKDAQCAAYSSEMRRLHETDTIGISSTLRSLNQILSSTKVLRVGGQ